MLTILGSKNYGRFCDGMPRRDFLTVGGMLLGGLAMPTMLQAEANPKARGHKAIINIYLPGGPPHIDMWDLKPDAPKEIRGDFRPIQTKVSGIEICELFPRIAAMMDKFTIIRSLADSDGDHSAYQCMTGRKKSPQDPPGGWPAMGGWVSKVMGNVNEAVPAHLSLMYKTGERRWGDPGTGGFLGMAHDPFRLVGGRDSMKRAEGMVLEGITLDRLQNRDQLRRSLDTFKRDADNIGAMDGVDTFTQKALGILTSSALADALDLSKENPKVVERYGVDDPGFERDGAPRMVRNFCIARRLVEAGARVVSMNFTRWDWHGGDGMNFVQARKDFPLLDVALSSLVEDLDQRGMLKDVSIVVWGEFGRTPKINNMNSRDHWPQANACVLAGGGMRTGQVIGSTNKFGEHPVDRPVKFGEVFATLYAKAGLPINTREFDLRGRPQHLVESGCEPLKEVM
jgi:hypothetical protein